jgi:hypothetical protein
MNGRDGKSQIGQFFFAELRPDFFVSPLRNVAVGDAGDGFSSHESGAFTFGVVRRLAPSIEPYGRCSFSPMARRSFQCMSNAISAAADLRGPQFYEMGEGKFEAGLMKIGFKTKHGLVFAGSNLVASIRGSIESPSCSCFVK